MIAPSILKPCRYMLLRRLAPCLRDRPVVQLQPVRLLSARRGSTRKKIIQMSEARADELTRQSLSFWFSDANLPADNFILDNFLSSNGWMLCREFKKFPRMKELGSRYNTLDRIVRIIRDIDELEVKQENGEYFCKRRDLELSTPNSIQAYVTGVKTKKKMKNKLKNNTYKCRKMVELVISRNSIISTISKIYQELRLPVPGTHDSLQEHQAGWLDESKDTFPVIALDVEYATLMQHGERWPALLSLSTAKNVYLIWLDKLPHRGFLLPQTDSMDSNQTLPPILLDLLADSRILKVGNNIASDAAALLNAWSYYMSCIPSLSSSFSDESVNRKLSEGAKKPYILNLSINNLVDLSLLIRGITKEKTDETTSYTNVKKITGPTNLKVLVELFLGQYLQKEKVKSGSNRAVEKHSHWRANTLTPEMRRYAAEDVSAVIDIFVKKHRDSDVLSSSKCE